MSSEAKRQAALAFIQAVSEGRLAEDLITDDFEGWAASSGTLPADRLRGGLKLLASIFPQGMAITPISTTVEDDRVAVQARSHGVLEDGQVYENDYVFLFTFVGERVSRWREYANTQTVASLIHPAMKAKIAAMAKP